jgi:hypothetical protein
MRLLLFIMLFFMAGSMVQAQDQAPAAPPAPGAAHAPKVEDISSPYSAKSYTNFNGKAELYDSGVVLGPREDLKLYPKKLEERQWRVQKQNEILREKILRKVANPRKKNIDNIEAKLTFDSTIKDIENLSPKQLKELEKNYWKNYSKKIKIRRKN